MIINLDARNTWAFIRVQKNYTKKKIYIKPIKIECIPCDGVITQCHSEISVGAEIAEYKLYSIHQLETVQPVLRKKWGRGDEKYFHTRAMWREVINQQWLRGRFRVVKRIALRV